MQQCRCIRANGHTVIWLNNGTHVHNPSKQDQKVVTQFQAQMSFIGTTPINDHVKDEYVLVLSPLCPAPRVDGPGMQTHLFLSLSLF